MTKRKLLSIVIPVFRESGNLHLLHQRLSEVVAKIPQYDWNVTLVNDGSPDDSWEVIQELIAKDDRFIGIDLSRNFGKEIALTAGVHSVHQADAVICLDADLQHPPEVIPELVEKWEEGFDVVATIRLSLAKQSWVKRLGSHVFYWVMNKISDIEMASQTTDFRLFDKKVVTVFNQMTERERMFRGIFDWMGFRKHYVKFHAPDRNEGEAGYSLRGLVKLAVGGITAFSLFPLKITGYLGVLISGISGSLLIWMLVTRFLINPAMFTPLAIFVVMNTFLIGLVLSGIGLVALYIGTIHTEVINRPLYIIRETVSLQNDHPDTP